MRLQVLAFIALFSISCTIELKAQERISATINSNWLFFKGDTTKISPFSKWQSVSIPHSWNIEDTMDDEPGYYRGESWYKKDIYIPHDWKEKEIYLYFEGAAEVTEVFINGKSVGKHTGSYTFFSFPISKYLKFSESENAVNEVVVKVDNSHNQNIPPLTGDYTFFGGIYRDVYLQALNKVHFDANNHASNGILISTPKVNNTTAEVSLNGAFVNTTKDKKSLLISHKIFDQQGQLFSEKRNAIMANPGQKINFKHAFKNLTGYKLWSIEHPYLYRVVSTITDVSTNTILDETSNPLGFRWFNFDASKGFFLNGKAVKLIGASRHQDFKGLGNALTDAIHTRDVELLKEMGGNFLRIAHYPQDPAILQACDRLGILAAIETPLGNQITETAEFTQNALNIQREMIRQNFNHPSLIIWAYMNEVLLRPPFEKGSDRQELYFKNVTKLAQQLENLTRSEDPYRYTMIPNHGSFELYNKVQLTKIPMLVGWNLYKGWYSGDFEGFGTFLDKHHKELPDKPVLITEYGADADIRLHNFDPVRFDKTVEYATIYHQKYLKAMMDRPFVAAGVIWNLAEFNSEQRAETTPHINAKGIMTYDRKPKDAYRFYQANLLKSPYIQIGSKEWNNRSNFAISELNPVCQQPVLVFSNQKTVRLKLNGKDIGSADTQEGIARFTVPFIAGLNRLTAAAKTTESEITDQADINFRILSQQLKSTTLPFQELNISLGDNRMFYDELSGQTWLPEQAYQKGSWGYIGGEVYKMKNTSRHSYGSDKNIISTELDPVFATQRTGIEQFKFDVANGDYELTLNFAELISSIKKEELAYNLGSEDTSSEHFIARIFSIDVNGKEVLSKLSNTEYLLPEKAVSFKFNISVNHNEGITVNFRAIKSQTILNAIQLKKTI